MENSGNDIFKTQNLRKLSVGACTQTPFLECFRQPYFSSHAYTFKISCYTPVIAVLLVILEISQC